MANIINFNDDKDQNKEQGQSNLTQGSSGASAFISPVGGGQQAGPQAGPTAPGSASSGKFTNIQKYIGANKGAGQQVATGVNQAQDKSLRSGRIAQEDEAKKFQAGAQAANETLTRGQGYNTQLQQDPNFRQYQAPPPVQSMGGPAPQQAPTGATVVAQPIYEENPLISQPPQQQAQPATPGFNAEEFVSDANRLQDFTKMKLGQGVDDIALANQAQKSQDLAGQNRLAAEDLVNRGQTEAGRFGLISQAFARPNYTQGQKRLDNLFLTGSGNKSIEAIQQKGKENLRKAQDVYGQATAGVNQAGQIKADEATLAGNLQNRANELESGLLSNLESMIPQINQDRDALRNRWQSNFQTLVGKGASGSKLDQDIWNALQLQQGERTFNVLNDPNLTLRQIADVSDRNAAGYADVANQADVNQYGALAKLAMGGLDAQGNFTFDPSQLKLTKASDMAEAVKAKTGDGSLRNRLDTATEDFLKRAMGMTITGTGEDSGTSGLFGRGGTASASASINLGDYLRSLNQGLDSNNASNPINDTNYAQMLGTLGSLTTPVGQAGALASMLSPGTAVGQLGSVALGAPGAIAGGIASSLGLSGNSGSSVAANARARQNLLDTLTNTLKSEGYNNYLTTGGNINTNDLADRARALETQRLSDRNDNAYYTNPLNTKEQQNAYADQVLRTMLSNTLAGKDLSGTGSGNPYSGYTTQQLQQMVGERNLSDISSLGNQVNVNGTNKYVWELSPEEKQNYINNYIQNTSGSSYYGGTFANAGQTAVNQILANRQATENKYNQAQQNINDELMARLGITAMPRGK